MNNVILYVDMAWILKYHDPMNIVYDFKQLEDLLGVLYRFTGVWCNIVGSDGRPVFMSGPQSDFCSLINSYPKWHEKCSRCDAAAVCVVRETKTAYTYRCYAGIYETVVPIIENGEAIAHVFFGQLLDESPLEKQWKVTEPAVADFPEADKLKEAFSRLKRLSLEDINSLADLLTACASYILLKEMVKTVSLSDVQKIDLYLDNNYMHNIKLETMARDLGMCKTKLCQLASSLGPGQTINNMIAQKRMQQAKVLLRNTDLPIAEVAERVGISNYNYFSRIFKKHYGVSPREYRKNKN